MSTDLFQLGVFGCVAIVGALRSTVRQRDGNGGKTPYDILLYRIQVVYYQSYESDIF